MPFVWSPLPDDLPPAARRLIVELRALKDTHNLSFQDIGRLTHYSRASWERWLNGKRPVNRSALESLLVALGNQNTLLPRLLDEAERAAASTAAAPPAGPLPIAPATPPAASGLAVTRPLAQLPAAVADFVGRTEQIDWLAEVLLSSCGAPGQVPIAVVTGGGGFGKTALALQIGHLLAQHFPDGQLHADLRGSGPAPRDPADVLNGWLRDLGQPPESLPADLDAKAAGFRSLVADKRCLVVLDDAVDVAQIRPLLPGSCGSAVLVTSRSRLVSPAGAVLEHLDVLPATDARCLFSRIVGPPRVLAEPAAAEAILAACGGLPRAVRLAATRLASRPSGRSTIWPRHSKASPTASTCCRSRRSASHPHRHDRGVRPRADPQRAQPVPHPGASAPRCRRAAGPPGGPDPATARGGGRCQPARRRRTGPVPDARPAADLRP